MVEDIGNIQYVGKHGSLAIDNDGDTHAVYWANVSFSGNRGSLRYAVRSSSGWAIQTLEGPPGMRGRFPNVAVDRLGVVHIATIDWYILNPANNSFLADLRYVTISGGASKWETIIAGYQYISGSYYQVRLPDFPSMALDSCGNPHIAIYYNVIEGTDMTRRGVYYATKGNCTSNRPPTVNAGGPYTGYEGTPLTFAATATDPDNDPLTYRWDFDNDGTADTSWSSSPTVTNTWSDDYAGEVRVEVSDGNATSNATAIVTILNLPPRIDSFQIPAIAATATLRIAGEKWHDLSAYLVDGGNETLVATLTRQPGKPQESSFPITIDLTTSRFIRVEYTPEDDKVNGQPNGATPAWLTFTFDSGPPVSMHHTFNVRHPETWNWTASLNQLMAGREIEFTVTATDPGSDDITFTWEWGDGTPATAITYYNDGTAPDIYPSPGGTFPFTVTDSQVHVYATAGTYDLRLRVSDDDGGIDELLMVVIII